jgi:hypothetical protein
MLATQWPRVITSRAGLRLYRAHTMKAQRVRVLAIQHAGVACSVANMLISSILSASSTQLWKCKL